MPSIYGELGNLNSNYPESWFRRFIGEMKKNFADEASSGIDLIISQRPEAVFPNMNEAQFKHYVLGTFQEFTNNVSSVQE